MLKHRIMSVWKGRLASRQQQIQAQLDEYLDNLNAVAVDLAATIRAYLAADQEEFLRLVGRDLVKLDAITAFISVLAEALVVDFFAHAWTIDSFTLPAIPVSATQASVGAIVGIGLARGIQTIKGRVLFNIIVSWGVTPLVAAALTTVILPLALRFA